MSYTSEGIHSIMNTNSKMEANDQIASFCSDILWTLYLSLILDFLETWSGSKWAHLTRFFLNMKENIFWSDTWRNKFFKTMCGNFCSPNIHFYFEQTCIILSSKGLSSKLQYKIHKFTLLAYFVIYPFIFFLLSLALSLNPWLWSFRIWASLLTHVSSIAFETVLDIW